jgi:hypothetical protein
MVSYDKSPHRNEESKAYLTSTKHEESSVDKGGHIADMSDGGRVIRVVCRSGERFCSTGKGETELCETLLRMRSCE